MLKHLNYSQLVCGRSVWFAYFLELEKYTKLYLFSILKASKWLFFSSQTINKVIASIFFHLLLGKIWVFFGRKKKNLLMKCLRYVLLQCQHGIDFNHDKIHHQHFQEISRYPRFQKDACLVPKIKLIISRAKYFPHIFQTHFSSISENRKKLIVKMEESGFLESGHQIDFPSSIKLSI